MAAKRTLKKKKKKLTMHGNPEHYFKNELYTDQDDINKSECV